MAKTCSQDTICTEQADLCIQKPMQLDQPHLQTVLSPHHRLFLDFLLLFFAPATSASLCASFRASPAFLLAPLEVSSFLTLTVVLFLPVLVADATCFSASSQPDWPFAISYLEGSQWDVPPKGNNRVEITCRAAMHRSWPACAASPPF